MSTPNTKWSYLPKESQAAIIPDAMFPTDNEWGIPCLKPEYCGDFIDSPVECWGAKKRTLEHSGMVHFYTDDARFTGLWGEAENRAIDKLWTSPDKVVLSGCISAVEPNFTLSLFSPPAYVAWTIYRKRWLARYWQEYGIRIWVDMNIPTEFRHMTLAGVPRGWTAFATRGYNDRIEALELEWDLAISHYGGQGYPYFLVIGGGLKVKDWCLERGQENVIWMPEESDIRRGRIDPTNYLPSTLLTPNRQRLVQPQKVAAF